MWAIFHPGSMQRYSNLRWISNAGVVHPPHKYKSTHLIPVHKSPLRASPHQCKRKVIRLPGSRRPLSELLVVWRTGAVLQLPLWTRPQAVSTSQDPRAAHRHKATSLSRRPWILEQSLGTEQQSCRDVPAASSCLTGQGDNPVAASQDPPATS